MADAGEVARYFGLADEAASWLIELAAMTPARATLPSAEELPGILARLDVPAQDGEAIQRLLSQMRPAEPRWLLDRCRQLLVDSMGSNDRLTPWVKLSGPLGPYFYTFVYLSTLKEVRRFHSSRGVPDTVSWATLGDLGSSLRQHRAHYGVGGLHSKLWLTRAFRGFLYRLGRLQFEMQRFPLRNPAIPFGHGEWALGVHVPAAGPLTPQSCDSSLACAGAFFGTHFPEHAWRNAYCTSWLLDPRLADYLKPTSNIVRFQQRFSLLDESTIDDAAVLKFVFNIPREHAPHVQLDRLPQQTRLQRAIVDRLRSGGHWHAATGRLTLP